MSNDKFSFYKEHPKTCEPNDFWGQVKRTINGEPVSQDQIDMIVGSAVSALDLGRSDVLLDLCCGNGALSALLFEHCAGGLGVDFSEYLIKIANSNFAKVGTQEYALGDVLEFCTSPLNPDAYNKALCYGAFQYIEHERASDMLRLLRLNFKNLERVFIGNCPDKSLIGDFFETHSYTQGIENEPDSAIGIWRTQEEFIKLAADCGWQAIITKMPLEYYAAHYRYDVTLIRE